VCRKKAFEAQFTEPQGSVKPEVRKHTLGLFQYSGKASRHASPASAAQAAARAVDRAAVKWSFEVKSGAGQADLKLNVCVCDHPAGRVYPSAHCLQSSHSQGGCCWQAGHAHLACIPVRPTAQVKTRFMLQFDLEDYQGAEDIALRTGQPFQTFVEEKRSRLSYKGRMASRASNLMAMEATTGPEAHHCRCARACAHAGNVSTVSYEATDRW
jgi:hypothetical protein